MSDEILETMRQRRTVREYTDDEVSEEQVERLLEAATMAPNRLNRQPWHFLVIREDEVKEKLAGILTLHPHLASAPVIIGVGARPELSSTWRMDAMAAAENLLLAATAEGLGSALLANPDGTLWQTAEEMLNEALHIPVQRGVRLPILVAVGYPAEEPEPHRTEDRFDRTKIHYGAWEERELGGDE